VKRAALWICVETITPESCLTVLFSCCKYPCVRNNIADSKEMRFKSDLHLYFHRIIMEHSSSPETLNANRGAECVVLRQSISRFDIPLSLSVIHDIRRLHKHVVKQCMGS
jgi:hypothetical protein